MVKPASASRLSPDDWIKAAFQRLGTGGIAAVRAEAIARDLKVSKGSFYWHFKDLPDLKTRMLAHWEDQATARIIAMSKAVPGPERMAVLLELATSDLADPYGGLSTEAAIRDWARIEAEAAAAQARTDAARLAFLTEALGGMMEGDAARAARLVLMAYTGAVHQGITDRARLLGDLAHLVQRLTGSGEG